MNPTDIKSESATTDCAAAPTAVPKPPRPALPRQSSPATRGLLASFDERASALDALDTARAARTSIGAPMCSARLANVAASKRSRRAAWRRKIAAELHLRAHPQMGCREATDAELAEMCVEALRPSRPSASKLPLGPGSIAPERLRDAMLALRKAPARHARHLSALFCLAMETGSRARELVAARWSDFDFEHGVWKVPATATRRGRAIPLSRNAMRAMRRLEYASAGHPRLFHAFVSTRSATRALAAALAAAGAQPITFRETRIQACHQLLAWHGLSVGQACQIVGMGVPNRFASHAKPCAPPALALDR